MPQAFPQVFDAFKQFHTKHSDALLYVHADVMGRNNGVNLVELGKARGVTVKVVDSTNLDPALLTQMDARARGHMAADQKFERALRDGSLR